MALPASTASGVLAALALALPAAGERIRVVDSTSTPVTEAVITLHAPPPPQDTLWRFARPEWRRMSSDDGWLDAPLPAVERGLLLVDAPGFLPLAIELPARAAGPVVALGRGPTWDGTVRAPDEIVEGTICASWEERWPAWEVERTWRRCAPLDPAGGFTLRGLPSGATLRLEVAAQGFLPLVGEHVTGREAPQLVLRPGELVAGEVVAGRHPVEGASVEAELGGDTTTSAAGDFQLAVPALPAKLRVEAAGYRSREVAVETREPLRIALEPQEGVEGILLAESGLPVTEARIVATGPIDAGTRTTRTLPLSLEDGRFRLDLPGPGRYDLTVRAAGFRDHRIDEPTLIQGERLDLGVIVLSPGAGIAGRVVSAGAEGVEGADVRLVPLGPAGLAVIHDRYLPHTVSDRTGRFELSGLDAGRYEVRIEHRGAVFAHRRFDLERDERLDLGEVVLRPGVRVRGTVTGRSGEPREGLTVRLTDAEAASLFPLRVTTSDAEGRFDLDELEPGAYRVIVVGERQLLAQELTVEAGDEETVLDLVAGGVRLAGVVVRGGEPVAGGRLLLGSAFDPSFVLPKLTVSGSRGESFSHGLPVAAVHAAVDETGRFVAEDTSPGPLAVRYLAPDGRTVERRVSVPDRPEAFVRVDVAGFALSGEVVDAASGVGREATVSVAREDLPGSLAVVQTDVHGRFAVGDLAPGRYRVEARAEGFGRASRRVELAEGARIRLVLTSDETGLLEVELRRQDGSAAASAMLALLDRHGRTVQTGWADARGRRRFPELPAGDYHLVWSDGAAGTGVSSPIPLAPGDVTRRWLTAPGGVAAVLACPPEECAGALLEHLSVVAAAGIDLAPYLSGVSGPAARLSADGRLSLGRVMPGRYLVRVGLGGAVLERPIEVPPGAPEVRLAVP